MIYLCFESKTPTFSPFFCENILKIITSAPDWAIVHLGHFLCGTLVAEISIYFLPL
jgi:hypothetical protein